MGRHSAEGGGSGPDAVPEDDGARSPTRVIGPVTDPLLLDAVQAQLRRDREERVAPAPRAPQSLADLQRAWQPYRRPADREEALPPVRAEVDEEPPLDDAADEEGRPKVGSAPALLDLAPPPRAAVRAPDATAIEEDAAARGPVGTAPEPVGLSVPMAVIVVAVGIAAAIALSVLAVVPH